MSDQTEYNIQKRKEALCNGDLHQKRDDVEDGNSFQKNASCIVLSERLTKNVRFSGIKYSIKQGGNYD